MRFVYAIAFEGERFLMILNPKRKGWEMPGGRVEPGEDAATAAIREFREETGQDFEPLAALPMGEGVVFAGALKRTEGEGEMTFQLFDDLPGQLAFPEVEYRDQIDWAKRSFAAKRKGIGLDPAQSKLKYQ